MIGNSDKHRLVEISVPQHATAKVTSRLNDHPHSSADVFVSDIFAHTELAGAAVFPGQEHTRPILKVQAAQHPG